MARSRNIKPGFFTNDVLGELPPLARLLFAGIWTLCDRAGRVEDRPKKIKAEVLPYDSCDADPLLQMLSEKGFITRYEVGGVRVIQVVAWEKHQNPHIKEAESTLPAQVKHGARTVQEPCKEQPLPERAGLIPDSGYLIPDSIEPPKPPADAGGSFERFWAEWPAHPRKVARAQCQAKWKTRGCEAIADQVIEAVEAAKRSEAWAKDGGEFIPSPLVWLNQSRWEAPISTQENRSPPTRYPPSRKDTQLQVAALMTGTAEPSTRHTEIIDAEPASNAPRLVG